MNDPNKIIKSLTGEPLVNRVFSVCDLLGDRRIVVSHDDGSWISAPEEVWDLGIRESWDYPGFVAVE